MTAHEHITPPCVDAVPIITAEPLVAGASSLTLEAFMQTLWNAFLNLLCFAAGIAFTIFTGIPVINIWLRLGIVIAGCAYNGYLGASINQHNNQRFTSYAKSLWFGMFVFLGYVTAPFIVYFMLSVQNAGLLMAIAGLSTLTLSLALIGFAYLLHCSGADKNTLLWGPLLGNILLGLFAASIMNIFLHIPLLTLVIAIGSAVLYSFYLVFDIVYHLSITEIAPVFSEFICVQAAANMALDVTNIFISILKIMAYFNQKAGSASKTDISQDIMKIFTVIGGVLIGGAIVLGIKKAVSGSARSYEFNANGNPYAAPGRGYATASPEYTTALQGGSS